MQCHISVITFSTIGKLLSNYNKLKERNLKSVADIYSSTLPKQQEK